MKWKEKKKPEIKVHRLRLDTNLFLFTHLFQNLCALPLSLDQFRLRSDIHANRLKILVLELTVNSPDLRYCQVYYYMYRYVHMYLLADFRPPPPPSLI